MRLTKKELEKYTPHPHLEIVVSVETTESGGKYIHTAYYKPGTDCIDSEFDSFINSKLLKDLEFGIYKTIVEPWINIAEDGDIDGVFYKLIKAERIYKP